MAQGVSRLIPESLRDSKNLSRLAAGAIFAGWGAYVLTHLETLDDAVLQLPRHSWLAPLASESGFRIGVHLLFYVCVAAIMSAVVGLVIERRWPKRVKVTAPGGGGVEAEALEEIAQTDEGLEFRVGKLQGALANLAISVQNIEQDLRYLHERVGDDHARTEAKREGGPHGG